MNQTIEYLLIYASPENPIPAVETHPTLEAATTRFRQLRGAGFLQIRLLRCVEISPVEERLQTIEQDIDALHGAVAHLLELEEIVPSQHDIMGLAERISRLEDRLRE